MDSERIFVTDRSTLSRKEAMLLERLEREYTTQVLREALLPLQANVVSLRSLDWAVVNWSKKHNVICTSSVPGQMTNVHQVYRTTLSFWKRRLFDPFRRRRRIHVNIDGVEYKTTLGQANFALWGYKTGILAYVLRHIDDIEHDMHRASKKQKERQATSGGSVNRKPRAKLTHAAEALCIAYASPSIVFFD